jgi:hypothetical protein
VEWQGGKHLFLVRESLKKQKGSMDANRVTDGGTFGIASRASKLGVDPDDALSSPLGGWTNED